MRQGTLEPPAGTTLREVVRILYRLRRGRLILAGGMPRSGSTLLFNIVRLALQQHVPALTSGWIGQAGSLPCGGTWLLKVHAVHPVLVWRAQAIIYTFRDVRDALVSGSRRFGAAPTFERCEEYLREHAAARGYATCMLKYEDFVRQPKTAIERVAGALRLSIDAQRVLRELPDVNSPRRHGGYDPVTLLHSDHSTHTAPGEWRSVLPRDLQLQINASFGDWLREYGYPLA